MSRYSFIIRKKKCFENVIVCCVIIYKIDFDLGGKTYIFLRVI